MATKKNSINEVSVRAMQEDRHFQAPLICDKDIFCPQYDPQKPHKHMWDWAAGERTATWMEVT